MSPPSPRRIDPAHEQAFARAIAALPPTQGRLERGLRLIFRAAFRVAAWRVDHDLGTLPVDGGASGAGCLIAPAPHRAWLEPFLLLAAWPDHGARLVWLADGRTVSRSWWRRRLLPRLGVIPVSGQAASLEGYVVLASDVLRRGMALVVFPETGPPSAADATRRIAPGFAYLALRTGATVVPVVVAGSHHIVRGSSFSLTALEPIRTTPMAGPMRELREPASTLRGRYQSAVAAELPGRNAEVDARRPARDRWRWLATLFR